MIGRSCDLHVCGGLKYNCSECAAVAQPVPHPSRHPMRCGCGPCMGDRSLCNHDWEVSAVGLCLVCPKCRKTRDLDTELDRQTDLKVEKERIDMAPWPPVPLTEEHGFRPRPTCSCETLLNGHHNDCPAMRK